MSWKRKTSHVPMIGSIGLVLPQDRATPPKYWPKDVMFYNGIWKDDKTLEDCFEFEPVHESVELFRVPRGHPAISSGLGVRATAPISSDVTIGYYAPFFCSLDPVAE